MEYFQDKGHTNKSYTATSLKRQNFNPLLVQGNSFVRKMLRSQLTCPLSDDNKSIGGEMQELTQVERNR